VRRCRRFLMLMVGTSVFFVSTHQGPAVDISKH
jgi:hypothetical protein